MNPPSLLSASSLLAFLAVSSARSAEISAPSMGPYKGFDISGNATLLGLKFYRNLDSLLPTSLPSATLSGPGTTGEVALSGENAVVTEFNSAGTGTSFAYFFGNLNTASGTVSSNLKLTSSDLVADDHFGSDVALEGTTALVGNSNFEQRGSAYLFRNLSTRSGTITQDAKLVSSDLSDHDAFGNSVSISGNTGLVGAMGGVSVEGKHEGSAYLYRNLDTISGTVTENVKLIAPGASGFGGTLSLSGSTALVGANLTAQTVGSAYIFRNLDIASGTVTPDVTLTTIETRKSPFYFGASVSLSGNTALVGANEPLGFGSAYLYRNVDTASGTVAENVKIFDSDGRQMDQFGIGVLEGDQFMIRGANRFGGVVVYTGSVTSLTAMDSGVARSIDGISFISQDDWIIGVNGDFNQVSLTSGDSGTVSATGRAVYIGQNAGSDNNTLSVDGTLTANQIRVGTAGNMGNALSINGIVTTVSGVTVVTGSKVGGDGKLNGNLTLNAGASFMFQTGVTLTVGGQVSLDPSFGITNIIGLDSTMPKGSYTLIDGTSTNFASLGISNWGVEKAYTLSPDKVAYFEQNGGLRLVVVPEPAALLLLGGVAGGFIFRRPPRMRAQRGDVVISH